MLGLVVHSGSSSDKAGQCNRGDLDVARVLRCPSNPTDLTLGTSIQMTYCIRVIYPAKEDVEDVSTDDRGYSGPAVILYCQLWYISLSISLT